jgi:hypothetical protein
MASDESTQNIERKNRLHHQQSARRPRKNQRALNPQSDPNQNIPNVTEKKKILRPILPPVHRRPNDQPDSPRNLEPQRQPHEAELYATGSGFKREPLSSWSPVRALEPRTPPSGEAVPRIRTPATRAAPSADGASAAPQPELLCFASVPARLPLRLYVLS